MICAKLFPCFSCCNSTKKVNTQVVQANERIIAEEKLEEEMRSPSKGSKKRFISPTRSLIELNLKNDDLESPHVRKRKKSEIHSLFAKANSMVNSFSDDPKIQKDVKISDSGNENFSNTLKDVMSNKMAMVL